MRDDERVAVLRCHTGDVLAPAATADSEPVSATADSELVSAPSDNVLRGWRESLTTMQSLPLSGPLAWRLAALGDGRVAVRGWHANADVGVVATAVFRRCQRGVWLRW